jgi:hypothetical protein
MKLLFGAVLISILFSGISRADSLSLPLEGYFHPGRAMPVMWERGQSSGGSSILEISANGAITSRVNLSDSLRGIFPWLAITGDLREIHWRMAGAGGSDLGSPLHPLENSDRLIGLAAAEDSFASDLFPNEALAGNHKIRIHLDLAQLIQSPAMAWESLDALVFLPGDFQKIPLQKQREFVAAGITLAVAGDSAPDAEWPWRKSGRLWIASGEIALPPILNAEAYTPTLGWVGGKSGDLRRRWLLLGAIFCLAVWGITLWRGKWMPVFVGIFSCIALCGLAFENQRQSPVALASGIVHLGDMPVAIADLWQFARSHRDAEFMLPVDGLVQPVYYESAQSQWANLSLECDSAGNPKMLSAQLKADWALAVVNRRIDGEQPKPNRNPATSPLRALDIRSIYPGLSVVGQIDDGAANAQTNSTTISAASSAQWPAIVLRPISSNKFPGRFPVRSPFRSGQ